VTDAILVHWNEDEARERASRLRAAGLKVANIVHAELGPGQFKSMWANPPDVYVIDLSRLPSHGREVGLGLRERKATRTVPIVFLEGEKEKVARIRSVIPDAVYGAWDSVTDLVKKAIANPPKDVPRKRFDAYSGTPLPEKLGIKAGVALIGAPHGFEKTIGSPKGEPTLTLWFVKSAKELKAGMAKRAKAIRPHGLWICWPKKTSGVVTDLSETIVRETGLAAGIVDFKICSIDSTWSGLKFTTRKQPAK
jgi:hypothetical protein